MSGGKNGERKFSLLGCLSWIFFFFQRSCLPQLEVHDRVGEWVPLVSPEPRTRERRRRSSASCGDSWRQVTIRKGRPSRGHDSEKSQMTRADGSKVN